MKKQILLISLLLTLQNAFAQCSEQKNFIVNWNVNENNISYEIKRKDGAEFSFFKNNEYFNQIYNGIKLDTSIKITLLNYAIFRAYPSADFNRVTKLLKGDNDQLSLYVNSYASSKVYEFPFEKNKFIVTKTIKESLNLKEDMDLFTRNNKIYGTHNIRYYIILFHDEHGRKCSYFESPEVKYDYGAKPFSLIWKDLWN